MKLFFLFSIVSTTIQSQKTLNIRVIDEFSEPISNCHIENLMTKEIVLSDDDGFLKIKIGLKVVLKFSHVQFKTNFIRTWKSKETIFNIVLKPEVFKLAPVKILNKLTGNLFVDTNKAPKVSNIRYYDLEFSLKDLKKVITMNPSKDERHLIKPKSLVDQGGINIEFNIPKSKEYLKKQSLNYKYKLAFYILNELGKDFFYRELKIPKDQYYLFIDYCNPLGIEEMHKKGDFLSLINLFTKESKSFLILTKNIK